MKLRADAALVAVLVALLWALGSGLGCKPSDAAPDAAVLVDPAATGSARSLVVIPPAKVTSDSGLGRPPLATHGASPSPSMSSSPRDAARTPPLPHPLADWMRGPATTAFDSGDLETIAESFEQLAPWGPEFANWKSIALDGADAARAGSLEAVKAACRGCHQQYEAPYKASFTARPLS